MPMAKLKDGFKLPPWLDHFNARDLQSLFRCSVAAWVAILLIFIGPSLAVIGQATFFASLVLFIVPPSGIVFIFILATLTLLIGICLAWAWGVIVMKAALAARPGSQTTARLQMLQQAIVARVQATGESATSVQQEFIFSGFMLDARVTVVYFVLICLFIYILARLRATNPKFALVQVFGTIIADLFLVIAPMVPNFDGTLPKTLIEPAAIGVGLGLASSILFFPQSTSSTVLFSMEGLLRLSKLPLDFTASSLAKESGDLTLEELNKVKGQIIGAYKAMKPALGFLPLDFSIGLWNAQDIESLKKPLRNLLLTSLSLLEFHIARVGGHVKLEKLRGVSEEKLEDNEKGLREIGRRQLTESMGLVQALQSPEFESLRSENIRTLRECSSEILPACQDAATMVADCVHLANSNRWIPSRSREQYQKLLDQGPVTLEALRTARASFTKETTERLIQNADIFDDERELKRVDTLVERLSVRGIMVGMIFEENILRVTDALDRLLVHNLNILRERPRTRLWFPTSIRYAAAWVFRRTAVAPISEEQSTVIDPYDAEASTDEAQQLLHISRGYKARHRGRLAKVILGTYHWFISAEGLYALRMAIVSIALGIPAVIPRTAGFYYREKGLWGLIMAQTTMLVYMADFTFSVVCRTIGTVIGGLLGLVAWYIGSSHGPGNPYGLAAITAAIVILMMWARLFFSPALLQASMITTATFVLTVGYSYNDSHIPAYGNPGVGYNVFWRRLVLVLVGVAAATIVQFFPRPPSATRHISRSLSNTIRTLSDHYALLLTVWAHESHGDKTAPLAQQLTIDAAEKLITLTNSIALIKFEFSSSPFDSKCLQTVQSLCHELNQHLGQLLFLSSSLPTNLQNRLARMFGLLDHRQVGDTMAVLGVVEQALKTGDPLPEVLPTPLLKRSFEYYWLQRRRVLDAQGQGDGKGEEDVDGVLRLGVEMIRDENYRKFCVAVSSFVKVLGAVDELVLVVKMAVGEAHVVRREVWSDMA